MITNHGKVMGRLLGIFDDLTSLTASGGFKSNPSVV